MLIENLHRSFIDLFDILIPGEIYENNLNIPIIQMYSVRLLQATDVV